MKIKSKEIAQALGLSTATVSLALNDKPGVNEKTKQRVREYLQSRVSWAEEIVFIKWIVYVDVRENFTGEIRSFFKTGYEHAIQRFQKERIEVRVVYAYNKDELRQILEISNRDGTSGIVLRCDEIDEETYWLLDECKVPLALEDGMMAKRNADILNFGNRSAIFEGMDYLSKYGKKKIMYLSNSYNLYNFDVRRNAYLEYLSQHPEIRGDIVEVGSQLEVIEERLTRFWERERPDALFLENYYVSMGTAKTLEKLGVSIPKDVSLVGIDAMPENLVLPYKLTYFAVPHGYRSYCTAELLLERINSKHAIPGRELFLYEELIEGTSIG